MFSNTCQRTVCGSVPPPRIFICSSYGAHKDAKQITRTHTRVSQGSSRPVFLKSVRVEWQFCMTIKLLKQRKAMPIPSTRVLSSRLFVAIVSRTHTSKIKKESEILCSTLFSSNCHNVTCGRDSAYFFQIIVIFD